MKKIVMIFAAMAAVLSSCTKNEMESVSANDCKDIVLNISVSNPGADVTKAYVKTGWVKDDQIKIWFDTNTGETPDLVIKYDGSDWEGTPASAPTKQSGSIKAVYNNFVIVASTDGYTYKDNTLSFNIKNWKFLTEIQVVVKGLDYDVNEPYTLSCDKFTPLNKTGFKVNKEDIVSVVNEKGKPAVGQANADGVAFVFATVDYSSTAADFKFTLKNLMNQDFGTKKYTATTDKISEVQDHKSIKALTIDISKFPTGPEYVTIGSLKWATMNLGATTVAGSGETCFGDYYAWAETKPYYKTRTWDNANGKWTFSEWETGKADGYCWQSYCGRSYFSGWSINPYYSDTKNLKPAYDVATVKLGTDWRMPTQTEFKQLCNACGKTSNGFTPSSGGSKSTTARGVYWCEDYDGVKGLLFIAAEGGPHLFFPAVCHVDNKTIDAYASVYWSKTFYSSGSSYDLLFRNGNVNWEHNSYLVYYGGAIRPVADVN